MAIGIHQSLGVIVQKKIKVKIMINTLSLTLNQKTFKVNYKIKKKSAGLYDRLPVKSNYSTKHI